MRRGIEAGETEAQKERGKERSVFEKGRRFSSVEAGRTCLCDSISFPLLHVTCDPVFPIPDVVTSWRGALGPSSVGPLKANEEDRNTEGRVRKKGFLGGWKRGENWAILQALLTS